MKKLTTFLIILFLSISVGFFGFKLSTNAGDCTSENCKPASGSSVLKVNVPVLKPIVNFSVNGTKVSVKLKADSVSSKKLSGKVKFYASGKVNKKVSIKKGKVSYSGLPKGSYKLKVTYYPSKSVLKKYKYVATDFAVKSITVS